MTDYPSNRALEELKITGERILAKTEADLKNRRIFEVARVYALVNRESEKLDEEARTLKLVGKLDHDIYRQLVEGYASLSCGIFEQAKAHRVAADVKVLSRNLKHSIDSNYSSLAQYLAEADAK